MIAAALGAFYGLVPILIMIVYGPIGWPLSPINEPKSGSSSYGEARAASIPPKVPIASINFDAASYEGPSFFGAATIPGTACPLSEVAIKGTQPARFNNPYMDCDSGDVSEEPVGKT